MGKVRILNTKTGQVKFVEEHIANDARTLKTYGFIKQDLPEKKLEIEHTIVGRDDKGNIVPVEIYTRTITIGSKEESDIEVFDGMAKVETLEETGKRYFELTGKKPGIKKQETLLKELQALETKQD